MATRKDTNQSTDEGTSNTKQRHAAGSMLTSQNRNMTTNIFQFFSSDGRMNTMNKIIKATATETQVSKRIVYRITSEKIKPSAGIIHSPLPKKRNQLSLTILTVLTGNALGERCYHFMKEGTFLH